LSKRILIYYHSNKESVSIQTQADILKGQGFQVCLLSIDGRGRLHENLERIKIAGYSSPFRFSFSILNYFAQIVYLVYFTYWHKIDFVLAHLHLPCFSAGIAQFFIRSKCIFFRHNSSVWNGEDIMERDTNINERRMDKVINFLAKKIIVPSLGVKNYMIQNEQIDSERIKILHYAYDFDQYKKPDEEAVADIKSQYKTELLLIMVSRMVKHKRHIIVFEPLNKLIKKGYDIKLLVLDDGPEKENLKQYVHDNALENHIIFVGFVENVIDYMQAANVLIQPSMTDASNSVSKEMGLLSKLVMVTEGVGDYSEYIVHGENGILIPILNSKESIEHELKSIYNKVYDIPKMGEKLREKVLKTFSKSKIEEEYSKFIEENLN